MGPVGLLYSLYESLSFSCFTIHDSLKERDTIKIFWNKKVICKVEVVIKEGIGFKKWYSVEKEK